MAPKAGTRPEDYSYWVDERVRFNDIDVLGHVNNIAYAIYVENGRAGLMGELGLLVMGAERQSVIVRSEMDYLREVRFPAQLRIGVAVRSIGNRSFTMGIGIFNNDTCVLVASNVVVRFDVKTRSSVVINEEERARLASHYIALGSE